MASVDTSKLLGLKDVCVLTLVSNFGVRWLAVAGGLGASSIIFWVIGALMLGLPMAIMCGALSRQYPFEGGLYAWVRHTLGERSGFIVSWLYFITNVIYYPAVLIFLATNFAFFLGKPALATNHFFIVVVVLIAFWLLVLISIFGLRVNTLLAKYGGFFGSLLPAFLIISLGFVVYWMTGKSATTFDWHAIIYDDHWTKSLANLTMIMFALTGVEVIPTFANSVKNPKKDLYLGLLIGAGAMVLLYILGTLAVNFVLSPDDIQKASGLMVAFKLIFSKLHAPWLTRIVAFMLCFAELAVISIWLIAPITMFFKCSPRGLLPGWFHVTNKNDVPINALIFVGVLVTIVLLTTNLLPAVNDVYQVLVLMTVLLTFVPYLFMLVAYVKSAKVLPGANWIKYVLSVLVFVALILGILFSFQLPGNIKTVGDKVFYEGELILGPIVFILAGYLLYALRIKQVIE